MTATDGVELPQVEHPEDAYVARPARPHLRVAPKPSRAVLRRRRRARFAVLGVGVISAASMFLLVAFHVFAVQSAFQLDKLDNQLTKEQRTYEQLRSEVDQASSPAMITMKATQQGMLRSRNVLLLTPNAPDFGAKTQLPVPPPTPNSALATTDSGP